MVNKLLTILLITGSFASWIAWDIYLASSGGKTESSFMRDWAWSSSTFVFTIGFLMGHWFLNRNQATDSKWFLAIPFLLALGTFDVLWSIYGHGDRVWFRYPGFYLMLGIPMGSWLWSQPF